MPQPALRVLVLLELLHAQALTSGASLARSLHVNRRTLRRYIVMLEQLGVPIATTQGRFGGYQLVPGFKLPPMMFTDEEALALGIGLAAANSLGLSQTVPAVASARLKIERVLPQRLKQRLSAVDDTVALELVRPVALLNQSVLALLSAAAQKRQRVHIKYQSQEGVATGRDFDPYCLVYRSGRWYAVGRCHLRRGLRSFRVDRVHAVRTVDQKFEPPPGFDSLAHLKRSIATLPRAQRIEVLLATDLVTAQRELFSDFGVMEWAGDGVLLRSQADDLNWFARELSRLPFDFEVRLPISLRAHVRQAGRRLLKLANAAA